MMKHDSHSNRLKQVGGALGRAVKSTVASARAWSARRLPGGEVTMWVVVGMVCLGLFVWAMMPGSQAGLLGGPSANADPQPVAVATARRGDIAVTLSALGTVTPLATATVTPQVSGQVMSVNFREGQMVRAGDLLAIIDPRSYQASLGQAKGTLAKDKAALANAMIELKRQRSLFAAKATSQQDLDSAEATAKQDAATVKADQASVDAAAINLGFTRVVSPISGRIGLRGVDVGNYVSAGQTTGIATVTQMNPMSVLFAVPEDTLSQVVARMNAGAKLPVEAYDRAMSRKIATGSLDAVDSQISTTTGTVKMRALFDNDDAALFPNQFVNIKLLVDTLHNQIVVPVTAIMRGSQGTYVFVVKADHTVAMRTVILGAQDVDNIAIAKGLNPGETVVTDGADRLSDGVTVSIPSGKQVADVAPAESAGPTAVRGPGGNHALFRKLTPDEREKLHAMSKDERDAWMKTHKDELMKRKDQPRGPGGRGPGGPPPM
ncbi:MAG: efflux RND transporter periplasmic adaptor subunit [Rhizomicrobium sp.]